MKQTPQGYLVTLLPGQHPSVKKKYFQYLVPYDVARNSPDGEYHICIALNDAMTFRCFYRGPDGV